MHGRSAEWAGVWMDGCMIDSKDGYSLWCVKDELMDARENMYE